jgi:MFS family permease
MASGHRLARRFIASVLVSNVGNGLFLVGLSKILYERSGSPAAFGIVLVIQDAARIAAQPLAGPLADQLPVRWLLVGADSARAVPLLAVGLGLASSTLSLVAVGGLVLAVEPFYRVASFRSPRRLPRMAPS